MRSTPKVYQGTTWGPPLWNTFFADAAIAVRAANFDHAAYADDLTPFRVLELGCSDADAFRQMRH
eukprot:8997463-Alexandrium_andersonii.AAC.1